MSQNYHGPDDATQPLGSPSQESPGRQGKLVLGGYGQPEPQPPSRRPYQYAPSQEASGGQPPARAYNPPPQYGGPQQGQYNQYAQPGVVTPHPQQPGQMGGVRPPVGKPKKKKSWRRRVVKIVLFTLLALVVIAGIFLGVTVPRVLDFGRAISTKDPLTTETNYMNTDKRTNLLILGYGGGNHPGATLTDSLVVASMIPSTAHTSLVSVPRDLWVQNPPDSGQYTKINAVYSYASDFGKNRVAGADVTVKKISSITGLDVKYWMLVDFNGFEKLIDSLGGIDIHVPDSFTANYPKNDDPTIDASWIRVHFEKGDRHFTGKEAIQYARARYVLDNDAESTDFARSARQQIMIRSTLSKMQKMENWPKLFDAMDALKHAIYTNMSLVDLGLFTRKMDLNDPKTARIGLNSSNVMTVADIDGQSVVVPVNNDWNAIVEYVKKNLYQ